MSECICAADVRRMTAPRLAVYVGSMAAWCLPQRAVPFSAVGSETISQIRADRGRSTSSGRPASRAPSSDTAVLNRRHHGPLLDRQPSCPSRAVGRVGMFLCAPEGFEPTRPPRPRTSWPRSSCRAWPSEHRMSKTPTD